MTSTPTTSARTRLALVAAASAVLVATPAIGASQPAEAAALSGQNQVMAKRRYFSHTTPGGRTFVQRVRAQGYPAGAVGENIAAGQPTPKAVMDAWMKSPGHRANILNCRFRAIGVGAAVGGPYRYSWTQDLGG